MSIGRGDDELTTEEAAAVLRRAAELDEAADGPGVVGRVHVSSLEQAALEVGVAPEAIHQALAELRVGALDVGDATGRGRGRSRSRGATGTGPATGRGRGRSRSRGATGTGPATGPATGTGSPGARLVPMDRRPPVRPLPAALRLVDEPPGQVLTNLDHLLRQQLFELRRREGERQLWRRREDRSARLQRRIDASGRLVLREIATIAVSLSPVDHHPSRTLVRLEAEVDRPEGVVSPTAAVAEGSAALLALTTGFDEFALLLAAGGAGLAVRRILRARARHRNRHREANELLGWLLDHLQPA